MLWYCDVFVYFLYYCLYYCIIVIRFWTSLNWYIQVQYVYDSGHTRVRWKTRTIKDIEMIEMCHSVFVLDVWSGHLVPSCFHKDLKDPRSVKQLTNVQSHSMVSWNPVRFQPTFNEGDGWQTTVQVFFEPLVFSLNLPTPKQLGLSWLQPK